MEYCAANLDTPTLDWMKLSGSLIKAGVVEFYIDETLACPDCGIGPGVCENCQGNGKCPACNGTGGDEYCYGCYGSGECDECYGSGEQSQNDCDHDPPASQPDAWLIATKNAEDLADKCNKLKLHMFSSELGSHVISVSTNPLKEGIRLRALIATEVCTKNKFTQHIKPFIEFLGKEMKAKVGDKAYKEFALIHGLELPPSKPKAKKKPVKKKVKIVLKTKKTTKKGK